MEDSVPSIYGARRNSGMRIQNFFAAVGGAAEARHRDGLSVAQHAYNVGQLAPFGGKMADVWAPEALIFFARFSCATVPRWYAGAREYALPDDVCDGLPSRVTCPVHVAYGDPAAGGLVSADDVNELVAAGMNLTSTHFPGAGHSIQPTFARELVADLRAFLERVS
ncbi:MAG TPA: alpha/beta hydrolase [Tepidiformaceae bacterium]|nr:alpha/beta hydrolase [Tepidiformaceae bacterium]